MYKVLTRNEDVEGNVFYIFQTNCFSLSEAKTYIKKKGNRDLHYVVKHNGYITHECKPHCFAARSVKIEITTDKKQNQTS